MRVNISQNSKEEYITAYLVKNKKIIKKVSRDKSEHYGFFIFRQVFIFRFKDVKKQSQKNRSVRKKAQKPTRDQPIKRCTVSPIKPRLLIIHTRVIIFIENKIKTFLTPSQNWFFHKPFYSHRPNKISTLSFNFRKRKRREPTKNRTLFNKSSVFKSQK